MWPDTPSQQRGVSSRWGGSKSWENLESWVALSAWSLSQFHQIGILQQNVFSQTISSQPLAKNN